MIRSADITVVFQGAVTRQAAGSGPSILECVKQTRKALPDATYVLATWAGAELPQGLEVDEVIYCADPGSLASIKLRGLQPNNINRQIVTTSAGLAAVRTSHAVKLRSDSFLSRAGFLDYYARYLQYLDKDAIVFNRLFSVDPGVFEQLPFHLSDWFQFGPADTMRAYWRARPMSPEEATHYERVPHAGHSTFLDREFRCLLAVEQHVCTQYAARLGYAVPRYHNDVSMPVMDAFRRFVVERTLVLDPGLIGLEVPKYAWMVQSPFQSMNCIAHADWYYAMSKRYNGGHSGAFADEGLLAQGKARAAKKRRLRMVARATAPFGRWLYTRPGKMIANRLLRYL